MAREVVIRILSEQETVPSVTATPNANAQPSPNAKGSQKKGNKQDETFESVFLAYVGRKAWAMIRQQATYSANRYLQLTENYRMQTSVQNTMQVVDGITDMVMAGVVGAKLFRDTQVGAGAGAVIGMIVTAISATASAVQKYEDAAQRIVENAYGNYFYSERAGIVNGGHGTEN